MLQTIPYLTRQIIVAKRVQRLNSETLTTKKRAKKSENDPLLRMPVMKRRRSKMMMMVTNRRNKKMENRSKLMPIYLQMRAAQQQMKM